MQNKSNRTTNASKKYSYIWISLVYCKILNLFSGISYPVPVPFDIVSMQYIWVIVQFEFFFCSVSLTYLINMRVVL